MHLAAMQSTTASIIECISILEAWRGLLSQAGYVQFVPFSCSQKRLHQLTPLSHRKHVAFSICTSFVNAYVSMLMLCRFQI